MAYNFKEIEKKWQDKGTKKEHLMLKMITQ